MTRRREQGNVVGYVLIGLLLTAALVGGIWLARHPIGGPASSRTTSDTTSSPSEDNDLNETNDTDKTTDEELKETLSQQSQSSNTQGSGSTTSDLPATGPTDTLFEMLGATLLAGSTVAYVRSRSAA